MAVKSRTTKGFTKRSHAKNDEITNLVLDGSIPPMVAIFYSWIESYCWKQDGQRNPFTIPLSDTAHYFNVKRDTLTKWLKTLKEFDLVQPVYLVRQKGKTETKPFKSYEKAMSNIKKHGGKIVYTHVFLTEK